MIVEPRNTAWLALWAATAAFANLFFAASAWATQPAITQVLPPGGQRGTDVDLMIDGKRLDNAQEILSYEPGIAVDHLEFAAGKVKAIVHIAADCPLGEHSFRLRTKTGLSDLHTFWVGTLPTMMEKEPNNEIGQAQKIDLNVTVTGVITGEDVDCFVVEAKKGQRLVAVIEGLRLGRTMFDPRVAILDDQGRQLTLCDDHPLVRQDSIAALEVPADGSYIIQVRDSIYGGNDHCNYRLHLGTFPQPTAVLPIGGKPGEEVEFHFLGDLKGDFARKIRLPDSADAEFWLFPDDDQGTAAAGIPVRVVDLPNVVALEPHTTMQEAISVEVPSALNGIIAKPGQQDFYRFKVKKGEVIDVSCFARRLRSPLDPVIQVSKFNGNSLAVNDDANGPDSYLRFTVPEDGEYAVSLRDQLNDGGPTFTYRLELTHVTPSMDVTIPKTQQFSQDRQTIVVARGNRYAARVGVDRHDFGGDVIVSAGDLPPGVSATEQTVAAALTSTPMVFEAAADAPIGGALAMLTACPSDSNQHLTGNYRQVTELVLGDNQTIFWSRKVTKLAVVVTDEAPFTLQIVEPKVPLVQNGLLQLKIVAERKSDFKAPITLEIIHSAPGVSSASNITIPEGQTEALFPLNANGNPGYGKWKMAAMGKVTVNEGAVWVSSQLATLEIAPAFVQFAMNRAAGELGKTAEIVCKIDQKTPFEGTAKAHLFGLPNKATAPELEFTKETQELTFPITIDPQSPVGKHKGIGCQVVITQNDEPICQNVGATELRIDPATPPKPEKKADGAQAAVNDKDAGKDKKSQGQHLSRLEKLRLEAQQKISEKATDN